jgi:hypothetical protein
MLIKLNGDQFFVLTERYKDWTCTLSTGDYHTHKTTPYRLGSDIPDHYNELAVISDVWDGKLGGFARLKDYKIWISHRKSRLKLKLKLVKGETK